MAKNDGGPAFPVSYGPDGEPGYADGMTLRDWFAGKALEGLIAVGPHDCDFTGLAHDAYRQADAMLAVGNPEQTDGE